MQLMVEKSDGTKEVYLHTKVIGSIVTALAEAGSPQLDFADRLSEAVTIYLLRRYKSGSVSSDEIHAMIQAVLSETQCEEAAVALHEHRITRQVRRGRIEVVNYEDVSGLRITAVPRRLDQVATVLSSQPWNKSVIIHDLMEKEQLDRELARAIAGAVEEKALRLQCRELSNVLIRELVNSEWAVMFQAEQALTGQRKVEEKKMVAAVC